MTRKDYIPGHDDLTGILILFINLSKMRNTTERVKHHDYRLRFNIFHYRV